MELSWLILLIEKFAFWVVSTDWYPQPVRIAIINNKNIFVLIDQKDSAGIFIDFFGKKVKTQIGFLKIARKYNLKLIPLKNRFSSCKSKCKTPCKHIQKWWEPPAQWVYLHSWVSPTN